MGINMEIKVIYGVKIDYTEELSRKFEYEHIYKDNKISKIERV